MAETTEAVVPTVESDQHHGQNPERSTPIPSDKKRKGKAKRPWEMKSRREMYEEMEALKLAQGGSRPASIHSPAPSSAPSSSQTPAPEPVTTQMLAELLRNFGRPDSSRSTLGPDGRGTRKTPDPIPLDNRGSHPSYESWRFQMESKFDTNHDHFLTARDRMAYLYNRTTGDANKLLTPRTQRTSAERWKNGEHQSFFRL